MIFSGPVSTEETSHTDFTNVKLTRQSDIHVKSPSDTHGCKVTDLVVLPGDLLLLANNENQSVKLVNPVSGKLLDRLQLPGSPHGLCLLPGDRAAVTIPNNSAIQTIAVTNKQLALRDYINVKGRCSGVDFVNDYFVVGFRYPVKVALIQTTGKIYKTISKDSQNKALFQYPDYFCVTTEPTGTGKVIYVSDHGTRTISRLSEELQVLQSFMDPELLCPRGLVSVGGGQLLIVNYGGWSFPSTLSVLDVTTGQVTWPLGQEERLGFTFCVAVSHTLRTVYVNHFVDVCHGIRQYRFR